MTRSLKKSLSAADSTVVLEQFVRVTLAGMHSGTWCEKLVATDVNVAKIQ